MDRHLEVAYSATPPSAPAASPGYPTNGNPQTATPATEPGEWWFHMMTEEIRAVIVAAGLTPDHADVTQLAQAIQALFVANQKAVVINNVTFDASVSNGEVVRWDSANSRFDEAVADGTSNNRAVGVADVTNSKVYLYGECPLFSGLTPGARYYLDPTTPGAITSTAPTDAVMVGIAKSATVLWADVDSMSAQTNQHGQSRLVKSGANLVLSPLNGNKLIINGAAQVVPAAGISLAATGLTPDTLYYIYAYMNAGTMALEASATGHSTDATHGVEIKTGDATRTLVGMARPVTGPAWNDTAAQRFVLSWFNRSGIQGSNAFAAARSTGSTSYVELSSSERAEFLLWADEIATISVAGAASHPTTGAALFTSIGIDAATAEDLMATASIQGVDYSMPIGIAGNFKKTEGYHYATVLGRVSSGTGSWRGSASIADRCTIHVGIKG